MALSPSVAVRRFAAVWTVSIAVKLAAIVVLVFLAVRFLGGS
ncbi:MAG: hypothetical protein WBE40_03140 [Thermoplasmata archaeon]